MPRHPEGLPTTVLDGIGFSMIYYMADISLGCSGFWELAGGLTGSRLTTHQAHKGEGFQPHESARSGLSVVC